MENNYNELLENETMEQEKRIDEYHFAGFWMRLWAFIVDMIVIYSLNAIFTYPLLRLFGIQTATIWFFSLAAFLTTVVGFLYFTLITKWRSQTLGKQIFGLRVIQVNGEPLTWKTVLFREVVGRYLHQPFFPLKLLYIIIPFSRRKQGLHDRIADTYVVHEER